VSKFEKFVLWAIALLILIMVSVKLPRAHAETWGVATVGSYHFDRSSKHCEQNWGLGIEHDVWKNTRLAAGFYRNSFCEQSKYALLSWAPLHYGKFHIGAAAGGVTGYKPGAGFVIMPMVTYEEKNWGLNFGIMPALDSKILTVIGLQLKTRF